MQWLPLQPILVLPNSMLMFVVVVVVAICCLLVVVQKEIVFITVFNFLADCCVICNFCLREFFSLGFFTLNREVLFHA